VQDAARYAVAVHTAIFVAGLLAVGLTAALVRFRSYLRKGAALLTIVSAAGVALWLTTPKTPAPSELNGTYRNPCCEALSLRNGELIAAERKVPFKLELLKFGLVANLSTPVEVRDGHVVSAPNASTNVLTFSNDLKGLTICGTVRCGAGHEYQFVRK
jgi:hypothetical protein